MVGKNMGPVKESSHRLVWSSQSRDKRHSPAACNITITNNNNNNNNPKLETKTPHTDADEYIIV